MTGGRGGTAWGPRPTALLGLLLLSLAACTFERRPDARAAGTGGAGGASLQDSIRAVTEAFGEARLRGDLAAALGLFDSTARVTPLRSSGDPGTLGPWLTPEEALAARWAPGSPGEPHRDLLDSSLEILPGGTALVLNRYGDTRASGTPVALETLVLVRGGSGWRIRHLHRTDLPPAAAP